MRKLKLLLFILHLFYATSLLSQSSKEILFQHNWKNLIGNEFKISEDTIQIDTYKQWIGERNKIITDSTVLWLENKSDTTFYFEYKVNKDSLMMKFIPSTYRIEKYRYLNCSFSNGTFCDLVDKNLTFYSENYITETNKKLEFVSFEFYSSNIGYRYGLKLNHDGYFQLVAKDPIVVLNTSDGYKVGSIKSYRTLYGAYSGRLKKKYVDSVINHLQSEKGLKLYFELRSPTDSSSVYYKSADSYTKVTTNLGVYPSPFTTYLITNFISYHCEDILANGFKEDQEPIKTEVYQQSNVSPPMEWTRGSKKQGNSALYGKVRYVESIKVKDSTNYVYLLENFTNLNGEQQDELNLRKESYLLSPFKIDKNNIGLIYRNKSAYYHTLKWESKKLNYFAVVDTFSFPEVSIFEYNEVISAPYNRRQSMQIAVRQKNPYPDFFNYYNTWVNNYGRYFQVEFNLVPAVFYSEMDFKIAKTLKKLRRKNE